MHSRIKAVREHLGLSQREFGEKIGVSRDVISNLEYNRVQPKELLIKHICQFYSINEKWLLSGEGDMFVKEEPYNKKLEVAIEIFKELDPDFQDYVLEQIKKLAELQTKKRN